MKNIKTGKKDIRSFGITIGIIFLIIAWFLFYKEMESFQIFIYLAGIFIGLGFILPIVLKPIYMVWMIFATILGWIMTRVIITILFYFILTPIGLIFRLFGKQFLDLAMNNRIDSYWHYRSKQADENNCENQF